MGKQIDDYYVIKALQLYLEGLSYREIERIIGVSHVSISSWVKKYNLKRPEITNSKSNYKILKKSELIEYLQQENQMKGAGFIITEFADKFMMIKWERFKK
ncbi:MULTISPECIES: helix-turn-helix domain-containing protein [Amniculibacterium]|uniref:helix-turn-helix domain-containing protein n=1 Tax=Amniculibacterium TaxID=2715289 RepID=UPI0013DDF453|nr:MULTISPECIES: helix-turn-helix domain-containing protein [Amniculibacterium]